jgi:flagellar protein FlbD
MIQFTKLDGNPVLINTDSIKHIEKSGDTIIHYLNGDTIIVKESIEMIDEMIIEYRKKVLEID